MVKLYLLSCTSVKDGGGIYCCTLSPDGTVTEKDYLACDRPMYAVEKEGRLHILLRAPFADSEESGYFSCKPDFSDSTQLLGTHGKCACHLAVEGKDVYVANYISGNLTKLGDRVVTHQGAGVNPVRQEKAHTHYVGISADMQFVFCTDLGLDTLFVYDRDLNVVSSAKVPDGYGIRHLIQSKNGKEIWAVNELKPSVSRFAFADGKVNYIDTLLLPCEHKTPTAAAIRLSVAGKNLYASVRGEDAIYVLNTDGGKCELQTRFSCGGHGPRDFDLCGKYLICCNEDSDNVVVLDAQSGELLADYPMKHPLCCVCF